MASPHSNKNLMLIAVYSCNPFEDYHGITIQSNILQFLLAHGKNLLDEELFKKNGEIF